LQDVREKFEEEKEMWERLLSGALLCASREEQGLGSRGRPSQKRPLHPWATIVDGKRKNNFDFNHFLELKLKLE
jgi:hypothetical protein